MSHPKKTIAAACAATLFASAGAFAATQTQPPQPPQHPARTVSAAPILSLSLAARTQAHREAPEDVRRCAYRLAEQQTRDGTYMPPRTRVQQDVSTCAMLQSEISGAIRKAIRKQVRP